MVPAQIRRKEQEAEIVDGAVMAARRQRARVAFSQRSPFSVASVFVQQPEDAGKESLAPAGPALAFAVPASADGIHRRVAGIGSDDAPGLGCGEIDGVCQCRQQGIAAAYGWLWHGWDSLASEPGEAVPF